jgi:hypothetical protein
MTCIFVSYSRRDARWVQEGDYGLIPWLQRSLKRRNVELWYDHALKELPGEDYRERITQEISRSQLAILLVSQEFLNSDFIRDFEIPLIRSMLDRNQLKVVPILVGNTVWEAEDELRWITDRQMLPSEAIPLVEFIGDPARWQAVQAQILRAILNRLSRPDVERQDFRTAQTSFPPRSQTRVSVELAIAPRARPPSEIGAVVAEEDRYLVLSADSEIWETKDDAEVIIAEFGDAVALEPGTVIARGSNPIHFLAVVHDLDQTPTCREEWVTKALEQIVREVNARDIRSVALPLLGGVHGSLSAAQFAAALCSALKQATREPSLRIWLLLESSDAHKVIEYLEMNLPGCRHVGQDFRST